MSASALELNNFCFGYPGQNNILGPITYSIKEGSFVLLTGKTGCGKTTLLRNCKPELTPKGNLKGTISTFGNPLDKLSAKESSQTIGYVSQNADNQLICSEVWHELAFGLENIATLQNHMRRRVAELANYFGMNSWLHQNVSTLSGGQKQLLILASVLALEPRILLLDEPTNQLDPVTARSFLHALFRVNRELEITIIVATHSPETMLPYATHHIELAEGMLYEHSLSASPRKKNTFFVPKKDESCPVIQKPHAISFKDVSFRYERKAPFVLKACSLEIKQETIHALVGANACGKTTLLNLAAKIIKPERGAIANNFASSQGFIPQDPKALFVCDSVIEELREWQSSCSYSDTEIEALLNELQLKGLEKNHPYDLSSGQQQVLAFAKITLTKPKLLILDEVTKGLDPETKLTLGKLCRKLVTNGTTILLATHDLEFAACVADEITMLFDGENACTEITVDFFKNNLFYRPHNNAFTDAWTEWMRYS